MKARIGMVNFINTAPLYVIWQQRVARPDWLVTEGAPTTLNRMLCNNELDLGFVSSHEYAANPHLYRIMEDISISSSGPVGSVFLFSRVAPEKLAGKKVRLSTQSQTSVALVKIILEEFYRVQPIYHMGNQTENTEVSGVLAIGDEALRLKTAGDYPFCLDLGETWKQHTGLRRCGRILLPKIPAASVKSGRSCLPASARARRNCMRYADRLRREFPWPLIHVISISAALNMISPRRKCRRSHCSLIF